MMNIVLCGDKNMYVGMELVIYSLLTHNKNCNIYILTGDISVIDTKKRERKDYYGLDDTCKRTLRRIVTYLDKPGSSICFIDAVPYYEEYLKDSINFKTGFTPYAGLRLIIDKAIPEIDDCLYLDCDTAIQGDISYVYHEYIQRDQAFYASYAEKACDGEGEMISGVMLMNIRLMEKLDIFNKARFNYNHIEYKYPDQMALRDTYEAGRLPESYGFIYDLATCNYNPLILHFTNQLKTKIYSSNSYNINSKIYFYRKYPQLKYVQKGVEMLMSIPFIE